jgi:YidC/Oxa1 family membrane protein insertase
MKEIQQKYKNDKEAQAKEMMNLYKTAGANPFGGCLPLIIQIVFLIAIYRVLMNISGADFVVRPEELYSFIKNPGTINHLFLNLDFFDLTKPNYLFAVLAAAAQYFQTKRMIANRPAPVAAESGKPDMAEMMNKQMLIIGPAMTLFIGFQFASALSLYWLVSTLFMIWQQESIMKQHTKSPDTAH